MRRSTVFKTFITVAFGATLSAVAFAAGGPGAPGSPCAPISDLRGSDVKPPASGDVATVPQLCAHDVSQASLERVPYTDGAGAPVKDVTLTRDQSLHPLSGLGAGEGATIDIRSINGNWAHLFSGAFWHAPAITAQGEIQAIDRGQARFSVAAALGYFAVVMPRFLARVKGTDFVVDFEPERAASFSVSVGRVAITRIVAIQLRDEKRTIDGIRVTDEIVAGGRDSVSYTLPLGIFQTFQNQQDAEHQLNQQLQSAIQSGDPQAVDDALNNIQLVTGKPFVGLPAHVANAQPPAIATALSVAAAGAGIYVGTTSQRTGGGEPTPAPTGGGSVTIQSVASPRPQAATPPPTPLPTLPPAPRPTTRPALPAPGPHGPPH